MTTAIFSHAPDGSLRQSLNGVRNHVRAFAHALFAAQGRQFIAEEARAAEAARANGRRQMFALADEWQTLSPNLSAELRSIAARD